MPAIRRYVGRNVSFGSPCPIVVLYATSITADAFVIFPVLFEFSPITNRDIGLASATFQFNLLKPSLSAKEDGIETEEELFPINLSACGKFSTLRHIK